LHARSKEDIQFTLEKTKTPKQYDSYYFTNSVNLNNVLVITLDRICNSKDGILVKAY